MALHRKERHLRTVCQIGDSVEAKAKGWWEVKEVKLSEAAYQFAFEIQSLVLLRWPDLTLDDIKALAKILRGRLQVETLPPVKPKRKGRKS